MNINSIDKSRGDSLTLSSMKKVFILKWSFNVISELMTNATGFAP